MKRRPRWAEICSPSTYDDLPSGYFNPFAVAASGGLQFNGDAARPRLALSSAVFQQMLVQPHDEIKGLWQRVRAAEASGKLVASARKRLETPPITEAQAADDTLRRQFASRLEGHQDQQLLAVEASWQQACLAQRVAARQLLEEVGA